MSFGARDVVLISPSLRLVPSCPFQTPPSAFRTAMVPPILRLVSSSPFITISVASGVPPDIEGGHPAARSRARISPAPWASSRAFRRARRLGSTAGETPAATTLNKCLTASRRNNNFMKTSIQHLSRTPSLQSERESPTSQLPSCRPGPLTGRERVSILAFVALALLLLASGASDRKSVV